MRIRKEQARLVREMVWPQQYRTTRTGTSLPSVINDDLIPFRKEDVVNLPSDLAKALKMQENYAYDPGHAKSRLLRDSHRPDFPTLIGEMSLLTPQQGL
jgi:hypothetical protein